MDKVKSFSQAIRLGAAMTGECRGAWRCGDRLCAIGAACKATGYQGTYENGKELKEHLLHRFPDLPEDLPLSASAKHYLTNLTREQIADWIEELGY